MQEILFNKSASILLIEERKRKDIVICAPHHSVGGIKSLPCPEHPDSDENTGLIARQIAKKLNLSSIIACNYRIDPNKNLRTDYSIQISVWNPTYLIEIHGHGAKKLTQKQIEISSGTVERNSFSILFAKTLQERISTDKDLEGFKIEGDFTKLYFKGASSATIIDKRWIPFHIELPPSVRVNEGNNSLPGIAANFIDHLIHTITEVCK